MAKSKSKKVARKSGARKSKESKLLVRSSLVALAPAGPAGPVGATVDVLFTKGLGQITATLFRKGVMINMQSISSTGAIHFSDVQSRDGISINGVCSGTAEITVSVPTRPVTPERFNAQIIMTGYIIL